VNAVLSHERAHARRRQRVGAVRELTEPEPIRLPAVALVGVQDPEREIDFLRWLIQRAFELSKT
jgi:hypothetical protein